MNEKKLYQSYLDMLKNSKIDIFISGNIKNSDEIIKVIKDNFHFKNNNYKLNDYSIIHNNKKDQPIIKEETKNYQQSKLSIGYKLYNLTDFENRYVSFVFNTLLGGGANSLLMRYIREEKSLCYYISSYSNRMDNIMIINSGINKENYDIVIELINEVFDRIRNGKFTEKDLKQSKMEVLYNISTIFESNRNIIEYYYGQHIFNSKDVDTKIKMINKVSKEDIIKYVNKINVEGIFFLKGDL
jgi:predicted Zn-dependent peptidase